MSKEMISIQAGNLMSVAETKGIKTISALKEKTSVDRKTLRAINAGEPVKQTTLQSIADRLRVPISHLQGSNALGKSDGARGIDDYQFREIKLQQLNAAALRELVSKTDHITWSLNIDQVSDELEATLLKLRNSLRGWHEHIQCGWAWSDPEDQDNLDGQISYIKTSADIDKRVEELAQRKLKIFGSTYIAWEKHRVRHFQEDYPLPILEYRSKVRAALSIVPGQ